MIDFHTEGIQLNIPVLTSPDTYQPLQPHHRLPKMKREGRLVAAVART